MSRKPKTSGLEWLCLSLASFNGSGYADKATPESYLASYRAYKTWKKQKEAVQLLDKHWNDVFGWAVKLCQANDAGHKPSYKNYQRFMRFYDPDNVRLL